MKTKNSIGIRAGEKELYRIFTDVELHSRATFSYKDPVKQQSIARIIGIRSKPLVERGLFNPIAITRQHIDRRPVNVVTLPIGVKGEIKKVGNGSRFYFKRER